MNLQWFKTARGEVLRNVEAPPTPERTRNVRRGIEPHIVKECAPWTPGAKKYVTDKKSEHYGQPILESNNDRHNFEARSGYRFDPGQERIRSANAERARRSGIR